MRIVALVLAVWAVSAADDMWGGSKADPLRPEKRKYGLHDNITIKVNEKGTARAETELTSDRRSRFNADLRKWIRLSSDTRGADGELRIRPAFDHLGGEDLPNPSIDFEGRFREDNTATTTRDANLTFEITADIVQILPNGDLVVEARKTRQINGETESMTLSGIVDDDVIDALTNTVDSERIENMDVRYDGSGSVGDVAHPGWVSKFLNQIWPFW